MAPSSRRPGWIVPWGAAAALSLCGCGTIGDLFSHPRIFGGTRHDIAMIGGDDRDRGDLSLYRPFGVLDLPLSFVLDVALVPVTGPIEIYRAARGHGVKAEDVPPGLLPPGADLKPGDVVLDVDGRDVDSVSALEEAVRAKKPGEVMSLTVRHGESRALVMVNAPGADRPAPPPEPSAAPPPPPAPR